MITGDNPLTAVHVAKEVEIVDRDVLILDVKEGTASDLVWKSVDDTITINVDPTAPFDQKLFDEYDICVTGVALKQFEERPSWIQLIQHTWVYARVSPSQKEFILTTFKSLGFTTLMAGDGTNDVGALKQAHIGVALLDGSMEDLKKIAEHQKVERIKKVYEQQVSLSARFNQPPPPVPVAIRDQFPELVAAQQAAATNMQVARKKNPMERFDLGSITDKLADMDDGTEPPKIKLGDASCAAPFTSKLSNVSASAWPPRLMLSSLDADCSPCVAPSSPPASHAHHPPGPLHARRDRPDVQNSRSQLSHHRLLALGSIPRRHQVWRLPGARTRRRPRLSSGMLIPRFLLCHPPAHHYRHAHERLLSVHLARQADRQAFARAAARQHSQPLRPAVDSHPVRDPHRRPPLHDGPRQVYREVRLELLL